MSFKEAVSSVFHKYATFSGRARRSEYWYFCLFNFLVSFVLGLLGGLFGDNAMGTIMTVISGIYSLAVLIPGLAVCWRRLHDIGKSGACIFLALIPLVGAIILIVWFCKEGDRGDNMYGPDPKAVNYNNYNNY